MRIVDISYGSVYVLYLPDFCHEVQLDSFARKNGFNTGWRYLCVFHWEIPKPLPLCCPLPLKNCPQLNEYARVWPNLPKVLRLYTHVTRHVCTFLKLIPFADGIGYGNFSMNATASERAFPCKLSAIHFCTDSWNFSAQLHCGGGKQISLSPC